MCVAPLQLLHKLLSYDFMNQDAYRVMTFNDHCMLSNPCEGILINCVRETIVCVVAPLNFFTNNEIKENREN